VTQPLIEEFTRRGQLDRLEFRLLPQQATINMNGQ
jgi:hypothetical protein